MSEEIQILLESLEGYLKTLEHHALKMQRIVNQIKMFLEIQEGKRKDQAVGYHFLPEPPGECECY